MQPVVTDILYCNDRNAAVDILRRVKYGAKWSGLKISAPCGYQISEQDSVGFCTVNFQRQDS